MVHDRGQLIRKEARTYETEEQKKIVKSKSEKKKFENTVDQLATTPILCIGKKEGEKKLVVRL